MRVLERWTENVKQTERSKKGGSGKRGKKRARNSVEDLK